MVVKDKDFSKLKIPNSETGYKIVYGNT